MKHQIIKPNGEVDAEVWRDGGLLKIILMQYGPDVEIRIDEKAIPQFADILQKLRKDLNDSQSKTF